MPRGSPEMDVFESLDDYSLLSILDHISGFGDLATVASLSPRAHQLIRHYNLMSHYNISNATLLIEIKGMERTQGLKYRPVGKWNFEMLCSSHDQLLATLKVFCPMFGQLDIKLLYIQPHDNFTLTVVDHINRYCSTVPQQFTLTATRHRVQQFTAPHVHSVEIISPELLTNFSIAEHFPNVQELYIHNHDYFSTTEHLPHLRHLDVADDFCGHFNVRAFAEKNPQITSVKLDLCEGLDILQEVNEVFPRLVSLYYRLKRDTVGVMPLRGEHEKSGRPVVHFRRVKSFTIDLEDFFYFFRGRDDSYFADYFCPLNWRP